MVEIIPKPSKKTPLWENILFYGSLVLLLLSFASFFILDNFQKKISLTIEELENSLSQGKTPEQLALEEDVFGYQKRIQNIFPLLNAHKNTSDLFSRLEEISHPEIQFTQFGLNVEESQLELSGITNGFQPIGQQLEVLRNPPVDSLKDFTKRTDLKSLLISQEGEVNFSLSLLLFPEIFKAAN